MSKSNLPTLGRGTFNVLICALVLSAAIIFKLVAFSVDPVAVSKLSPWVLLALTFAGVMFGAWLTHKKDYLALQLLGFAIIPSVLGFISAPWMAQVDPKVAYEAGSLTLLCTGVMMILSGLFPKFFIKIRGILVVGLIALILVGILGVFVLHLDMTFYHVGAIILFLGFLGYDLVVVRQSEPSVSNAILLSSSLFIDLLNLFMHIYSLIDD